MLICVHFICLSLSSQSFDLEGILQNSKTNEFVEFATIYNLQSGQGTVSNEKGFFRLENVNENDSIRISFIGFETKFIQAKNSEEPININISTSATLLSEIVVLADDHLLYQMIYNTRKHINNKERIAKTYFELETKIKGEQVELVEAYYNAKFTGQEVEEISLKNGRLGLAPDGNRFFISKETSKGILLHQSFNDNSKFPVSPIELSIRKCKKTYRLNLVSKFKDDADQLVMQIAFQAKEKNGLSFDGNVWIDSLSNRLIKVELKIQDAKRSPFFPLFTRDKLDRIDFEITKTYQEVDKVNTIQSIHFNYEIDYNEGHVRNYLVSSKALLYAYNYKERFMLPTFDFSPEYFDDYRKISAVPINQFFWRNINEFQLKDRKIKNDAFIESQGTLTRNLIFEDDRTLRKGLFEQAFLVWDEKRLIFKEKEIDPKKLTATTAPSNRYNLKAHFYVDVNELNDTLHVLSTIVIDPFESFFNFPMNNQYKTFINLYFDIFEMHRRDFENALSKKVFTKEEIYTLHQLYNEKIISDCKKFRREVQRGINLEGMRDWNQKIRKAIGIDNMQIFEMEKDLK
jgi:hypothetical protein